MAKTTNSNSGILQDLHRDHQEVSGLITRMLDSTEAGQRGELIKEIGKLLISHSHAEQNVLYRKMEKSDSEESRSFAFEGTNEHQIVERQIEQLTSARDKAGEKWTAQATVLKELVEHHVKEEESTGFDCARKEFDADALDKMGEQFRRQKEKLMAEA